jgi:hypothetical protein
VGIGGSVYAGDIYSNGTLIDFAYLQTLALVSL